VTVPSREVTRSYEVAAWSAKVVTEPTRLPLVVPVEAAEPGDFAQLHFNVPARITEEDTPSLFGGVRVTDGRKFPNTPTTETVTLSWSEVASLADEGQAELNSVGQRMARWGRAYAAYLRAAEAFKKDVERAAQVLVLALQARGLTVDSHPYSGRFPLGVRVQVPLSQHADAYAVVDSLPEVACFQVVLEDFSKYERTSFVNRQLSSLPYDVVPDEDNRDYERSTLTYRVPQEHHDEFRVWWAAQPVTAFVPLVLRDFHTVSRPHWERSGGKRGPDGPVIYNQRRELRTVTLI